MKREPLHAYKEWRAVGIDQEESISRAEGVWTSKEAAREDASSMLADSIAYDRVIIEKRKVTVTQVKP